MYHRTASNLLLEYSAARQRIRQLVLDLRIIHRRLIAKASQRKGSHRTLLSLWRQSDHSSAYKEDDHSALASGLGAVIADLSLLAPYLDRMTDQLVSSTLSRNCASSSQRFFRRTSMSQNNPQALTKLTCLSVGMPFETCSLFLE